MSPRLPSLLPEPIRFAHRGASALVEPDTLESFRLAVRLGATGIETDVWSTADGEAVLRADDRLGRWGRRRVGAVPRSELPAEVPTLAELYGAVGPTVAVSLGVGDPAAVPVAVATAEAAGAVGSLWLRSGDRGALAGWRAAHAEVRLVWETSLRAMEGGPERAAAELRAEGVDAVHLHQSEWTGGLVALFHRFGRLAFAGDAQHTRIAASLVRMGIDAMASSHPDRLADGTAVRPDGSDPSGP